MSNSANTKRIAKNTALLYIRTFITMIVGLYTGRVMLQALGIEGYGINSVVGGIVAMSSLITNTMSQAIGRYVSFALGTGNKEKLKTMFSTAINAQIVIAVLVALALECVGVWFLNNEANIPEGRMVAANWVFQCSILVLMISLVSSPFSALIIAHERMGIYAYMSIVDVFFKLAICLAIMEFDGDRLILLAVLQLFVALCMQVFYGWYCCDKFEEARYSPIIFDKNLMQELTVFSGWNLMSNGAYVFATQGVNILVNLFFGVVFNASRSIAMTVNGVVQGFAGNFTMVFSPQITKSYAAGDVSYAILLVINGTKFTWLLMYLFIVPVCVEADTLLKLWLGEVPDLAPLLLRFSMFESLAVSSGQNLFRLILANGNIRYSVIHAAILIGLIFPLVWIVFYIGAPIWVAYLIFIIVFMITNVVRLYDIKRLMTFSVVIFVKKCIVPCVIVSITSFILPLFVLGFMEEGILRFFVNVVVSIFWTICCCLMFGLTKKERIFIINKAHYFLKRNKKMSS